MKEIKITTDSKNYPVLVGTEILTERNFEEFSEREILLVIDSNINSAIKTSVKESLNKISSNFIHITIEASEENKSNSKWLRRAVSRMFNKECTDDPLFEKIAIAYAEASPSADAYSFVAGVLEKKDDISGAQEMRMKAFDLETDPFKKANFKLKFAQAAKKRGQKSRARQLAREAIALNPNMGRAYLFIASLYAESNL